MDAQRTSYNELARLAAVAGVLVLAAGMSFALDLLRLEDGGATIRLVVTDTGNVGMGTATPHAKAALEVASTTQGFLPPRMTTTQRDAIATPPVGLQVFNTTTDTMEFYTSSGWVTSGGGGSSAPVLLAARVDGQTLVMSYATQNGLNTTSTPANGDFAIGTSGAAQTVAGVSVHGGGVILTLSPGVLNGDVVTLSYTPGVNKIQDAVTGTPAAPLLNHPVINDTTNANPGLLVYYTFNELSGPLINRAGAVGSPDDLGPAYDGVVDVLAYGVPGILGTAYSFDRLLHEVTIQNVPVAHYDFTLQYWFKMGATLNTVYYVMAQTTNNVLPGFYSAIFPTTDRLEFTLSDGTSHGILNTTAVDINDDAWHHVVFVRDFNTGRLYVDGVERTTANITNVQDVTGTGPLILGNQRANWSTGLDGELDEVAIWNYALSPAQITALYNGGAGAGL